MSHVGAVQPLQLDFATSGRNQREHSSADVVFSRLNRLEVFPPEAWFSTDEAKYLWIQSQKLCSVHNLPLMSIWQEMNSRCWAATSNYFLLSTSEKNSQSPTLQSGGDRDVTVCSTNSTKCLYITMIIYILEKYLNYIMKAVHNSSKLHSSYKTQYICTAALDYKGYINIISITLFLKLDSSCSYLGLFETWGTVKSQS